jgi:TetR/AcrR family transcriptional regulator
MSSVTPTTSERLPAAERRELILKSASEVFGLRGYSGTTTDQVAQAAGISQPYVVRMFGTKEKLFLEVLERALTKLVEAFAAVLEHNRATGGSKAELTQALGLAYADLIEDRGILLSLMQGFVQGHDEVIGKAARAGFLLLYRMLREEAGFSPEEVQLFLAHGMLFNTLLAIRLPELYGVDPLATELMEGAFGHKLGKVIDSTRTSH